MSERLSIARRVVQWVSLAVLNSNFWGIGFRGGYCIPVMNCEACVISWLGCPIGRMSSFIAFHEIPWLVLGITLVIGVLFGRFFCGWICPIGLLQDLLHKIPSPKIHLPRWLTWPKYAFLLVTVVLVAYISGKYVPWFFCQFCPTATIQVVIPEMAMSRDYSFDQVRSVRFVVLALFLIFAVLNHRSFCKIMCPIGALIALTNKFSLFGLRLNPDTCVHCHKCDRNCPMDVPVENSSQTRRKINRDTECIECLNCEQTCPVNAISNNSRLLHK